MEIWNTRAFFEATDGPNVTRCLEAGADLGARDESGWTPLHYAASVGCPDVVTALLEAGANLEARADDSLTPLHAASVGNTEAVKVLLEAEADLEARVAGPRCLTPLRSGTLEP